MGSEMCIRDSAGHVCWISVCSRAGCSHFLDQYEPPAHDEIFGEVVPGDAPEDEEGRGVPLFLAAGQLQLRGALQCLTPPRESRVDGVSYPLRVTSGRRRRGASMASHRGHAQAKKHVDGNNIGPSYIISLGKHTGGNLWTADQGIIECHDQWKLFDGNTEHYTTPFKGCLLYTSPSPRDS